MFFSIFPLGGRVKKTNFTRRCPYPGCNHLLFRPIWTWYAHRAAEQVEGAMSDRKHRRKPEGPQNVPVYTLWRCTFLPPSWFSNPCVWEAAAASRSSIRFASRCTTRENGFKAAAVGLQECLGSMLASTGRHPTTSRYKLSKWLHHR